MQYATADIERKNQWNRRIFERLDDWKLVTLGRILDQTIIF